MMVDAITKRLIWKPTLSACIPVAPRSFLKDIMTQPTARRHLLIATLILLLAALLIISRADDLSMWFDELWTMLHVQGDFESILRNRDTVWPPGYYLLLHMWTRLVGNGDFSVHMLGALCGLLTVAFTIAIGRRFGGALTGWLAGLALAVSGYALYFMLEARGYTLMLLLVQASVYLHLRWFDRPTVRRALPYVLAQTALIYTHFTSLLVIGILGLRVLLAQPRRFPAWLAIMSITALLYVPMIPQAWEVFGIGRTLIESAGFNLTLADRLREIYSAYSVGADVLFALLLVLTSFGLALHIRRANRAERANLLWLLAWGVGIPAFAYLGLAQTRVFSPRYISATMPAIFLLIGMGLAALHPRWLIYGGAGLLLTFTFVGWQPFDFRPNYTSERPTRDLLRELALRAQPGDALVVDPLCECLDVFAWGYYAPVYFPNGLPVGGSAARLAYIPADLPPVDAAVRRVWYVTQPGQSDGGVRAQVEAGRLAITTPDGWWQTPYFEARLFVAPPLTNAILLALPETAGAVSYLGGELIGTTLVEPGATLTVHTWWRTAAPLPVDYAFSVYVVHTRHGQVLAQSDGAPAGAHNTGATSTWLPSVLYRDERTIQLPWNAGDGYVEVRAAIYQWWDGVRLEAADGADSWLIARVKISNAP